MGELLKKLNISSSSIGSSTGNTKMNQFASTSPSDMVEEETSSASVKELPPQSETVDKRSWIKDRMTATMVREGLTSITLYDWQYEKMYGIVGV